MLRASIRGFAKAFGESAKYVVFTDSIDSVQAVVGDVADVRGYTFAGNTRFDTRSVATWRKWCPVPRLAPGQAELLIDADVFLVGDPWELREFCLTQPSESGPRYIALRELIPERWQFGRLDPRVPSDGPPLNAGLVGQRGDGDLTVPLAREFEWWTANIRPEDATAHDEQGAVAAALASQFANDRLHLLPVERYCLVSPRSNPSISEISRVALIHATYPDHPAFTWFRHAIRSYLGDVEG